MKVAIIHDWLTNLGGAERVVDAMLEAYPDADLFTSVYDPTRLKLFHKHKVNTSFIQKIPIAWKKHQLFPVMRRYAFEAIDLHDYDVVITSSTAEAKGVITGEQTFHISYINTPTRYYWSHYSEYMQNPGFGVLDPLARWQLRRTIDQNRQWDFAAAQRADKVLGNSKTVVQRIKRYYKRDASVLYPNVEVERFTKAHLRPKEAPEQYFLVVSRLIPYKRVDVAIEAANLAGIDLVVIGSGSQLKQLREIAGENVHFLTSASDDQVTAYMQHAEAFVFPGEEDFGITPVESMAAGVPVIGYGRGGVAETVLDGITGILVPRQTATAFAEAFGRYRKTDYQSRDLLRQAQRFDRSQFIQQLKEHVRAGLHER